MDVQVNEAVVSGWLFFRYLVIGGIHKRYTLFCLYETPSHIVV